VHTCTYTLLLSDPGLLLAESPAVASAAAVVLPCQQPVSGKGCSGGKEISRGARTGFLPATENASWEGGWILRNQEEAQGRPQV